MMACQLKEIEGIIDALSFIGCLFIFVYITST
jgi:hypothetical protein